MLDHRLKGCVHLAHTCFGWGFAMRIGSTAGCPGAGVSLKTQELYALVFICRYLDLFTRFISL